MKIIFETPEENRQFTEFLHLLCRASGILDAFGRRDMGDKLMAQMTRLDIARVGGIREEAPDPDAFKQAKRAERKAQRDAAV